MLPSANRLKKKKDFETIFKSGRSFRDSLLALRVISNKLEENRFGFVVSQKVSRKAVLRNKIRRRMVVVTKKIEYDKKGNDFVFIALPGAEKAAKEDLEGSVKNLLKKAGVTK